MKTTLALIVGIVAVSTLTHGSGVNQGLNVLRGEVREELQWLEGLEAQKIEAFLKKNCPATLIVINKLGAQVPKAKASEKQEIRQEIADFLEDVVYLRRELQEYQKQKKTRKAKACLQIFILQDQKVLAGLDLVQLERKKAKPAQIKSKEEEIEKLDQKIDQLYETLDTEPESK
jgi:hypothetical protein